MTVPDFEVVTAAWLGLPQATRDSIGLIAVDMVSQGFVYGDACVAGSHPWDRAVDDEEIRDAAGFAEDRRLNELHAVVEAALPDLFGAPGENPMWCENPGPRP